MFFDRLQAAHAGRVVIDLAAQDSPQSPSVRAPREVFDSGRGIATAGRVSRERDVADAGLTAEIPLEFPALHRYQCG